VFHVRHPRVTQGTEQDDVEVAAQLLECAGRQRDAFAQVALCAPVELSEVEAVAADLRDCGEDFYRLAGNLDADAVTRDDRDSLLYRLAQGVPLAD